MSTTHYVLLGVTRHATLAELTAARRRLAAALHPDRAGEASGRAMAEVNVAYDTLADKAAHAKYRAALYNSHTDCKSCGGAGGRWKSRGFTGRVFNRCQSCNGSGLVEK